MRNGGRGRPLNSVVRHHVIAGYIARVLCIVVLAAGTQARAVCIEPKPTLEAEFDSSPTVVLGHVVSEKRIAESSRFESGGISYVVAVDEVLKGPPRNRITLTNQNDSGRFPMDRGKSYLLFVTRNRDGLGISNCGNSGETAQVTELVERVRKLKQSKGT